MSTQFDHLNIAEGRARYWESQPTDQPHLLNGFKGTWNFSDYNLIPEPIQDFLLEVFHPQEKLKRIPLEDLNKAINDFWDGPGSMPKLVLAVGQMRHARSQNRVNDDTKQVPVPTIDDFNEMDFDGEIKEVRDEE